MDDSDSDGVWVVTLSLDPTTANGGKFIFLNSPTGAADWATKEVLAGLPCGDPANYDDRTMPPLMVLVQHHLLLRTSLYQ